MIRVTVWNEFCHEAVWKEEAVLQCYPDGIHKYLESFLKDEFEVKTVTLYDENGNLNENAGISWELLDNTDVLIWWAHAKHHEVKDEVIAMVAHAVRSGMGMIFLHSAHHSKLFQALMGTTGNLHWREDGDFERVWVIDPSHPIAQGIGEYIYLEEEETYGEPFGIPEPDKLVFIGTYEGGEVFRSGCCWQKEYGKVFYFQPGRFIRRIITNNNFIDRDSLSGDALQLFSNKFFSAVCGNDHRYFHYFTCRTSDGSGIAMKSRSNAVIFLTLL